MSLFQASLATGILLLVLGLPLLLGHAAAGAALKAMPRSSSAAKVFFGGGAVWFLYNIWHLSAADFGDYHVLLFAAFAAIALLSFKSVPDFLAVRGGCVLVLLGAMPLLDANYMRYDFQRRLFLTTLVYLCIGISLWLGAQPWRARDFLDWLFARPGRSRKFGGILAAYGFLLCAIAFSY